MYVQAREDYKDQEDFLTMEDTQVFKHNMEEIIRKEIRNKTEGVINWWWSMITENKNESTGGLIHLS